MDPHTVTSPPPHALANPPQKPKWWSRNWRWAAPVGCAGAILMMAAFVAGAVTLVMGVIRSSEPYQQAMQRARSDERITAALGAPIVEGWWVNGEVSVSQSSGEANLGIPVHGSRAAGTIHAVAKKSAGKWRFSTLELHVDGALEAVSLLGWTELPGLPTPRFLGPQVAAVGGRIYVVGGLVREGKSYSDTGKLEIFDCSSGVWTEGAPMPTARSNFAVAVVADKIFAVGGSSGSDNEALAVVEEYDPSSNRWERRADMPTPRWHLAVGAIGDQIYAIGGRGGNQAFESYDVRTGVWTRRPNLASAKENPYCAVVDGRLFVLGGSRPDGKEDYGVFEEYQPDPGRWVARDRLPKPRTDVAIAAANGRVLVIGGWRPGGLTADVDSFDPATNTWTPAAALPAPLSFAGAASIQGRILLVGGARYMEDQSLAPRSLMQMLEP